MNLEEFKLASKEELKSYGDNIPLKSTYDNNNNELTYKDSKGYWHERTYDSNNNQLTCNDSDGYWCEYTYNSNNNLLTYNDSDGFDGIFLYKGYYTLYYNKTNNKYKAGCQELTYDESLAYYNKHKDKHQNADKILEAIKKHHKGDKNE